ncbi:hypothetical protein RCH10_005130 [Variovorax sp. GrIS 2.14]|uniref:IS66 family transposase n=1 Tax=Variovorax sp. GrIS 2.14 TaxID=3071709 RepID=UPI0038F65FD1
MPSAYHRLEEPRFKRAKFGASSERLTELAQLELLVEELESEQAALDADGSVGALDEPGEPGSSEGESAQTGADQRKRPARKPLPDHLPREALAHQPSNTERCACEGCNGALPCSDRTWPRCWRSCRRASW